MNAARTLMLDPGWVSDWQLEEDVFKDRSSSAPNGSGEAKVPMWIFIATDGGSVFSKKPVDVEVRREGPDRESFVSAYVFSCNKLHVFASAATRKEAESLFNDQVVHFFRMYRDADPRDLAEDAAAIKALYDENFAELHAKS